MSRLFNDFKTMHENDCKNNTATIGICDQFLSAQTCKGGAKVEVGVPANELMNIISGKRTVVALLIDTKEYKKVFSEPEPLSIADYEDVLADNNRLVRELDIIINGKTGAAKQASLVDLVSQIRDIYAKK